MKKTLRVVLLIMFTLLIGTQMVSAEESHGLNVYNTRLVTNDKDATFIEGEIPESNGQSIILKSGLHVISEKKMPNTGMPAQFKLKVPAEDIGDNNVAVLYISERKDGKTVGRPERVEIEFIEKQQQTISVDSDEYDMTYPGLGSSIKAEATSGERLIYTSSDTDVVEVDEEGRLTAKGGGEVEVSVKQIGSSAYEEAEEIVRVSVEEIDAYTVTFHPSIGDASDVGAKSEGGSESKESSDGEASGADSGEAADSAAEEGVVTQIIEREKGAALQANEFENGSHKFLGWATEDGGLREFHDGESVGDLAEKGENVDLYAVWTGDGPEAAVAWAIDIANDDSFAYGKKPAANAIGCYFCGTNCGPVKHNKPKGYEKTYVCLTFVAAAYAHGTEDPEVYYACSHGKMPLYENDKNFSEFSCWKKIGSCKSLSVNDLQPGDVIINWSAHSDNSGHTCMYIGGNDLVEASGGGWGANSIAVKYGAASGRLKSYSKNSKNYVMRYVGPNA